MSTSAIAKVYDNKDNVIMSIYKHWDGYPDGFGNDLKEFVSRFTLVNAISRNDGPYVANGMDCFAASLVKHFKKGPGDVYLSNAYDSQRAKYVYHLKPVVNRIVVNCDEM